MSRLQEKKKTMKKKKIFWYRTWMGHCPTELKAGRWAGRGSRMSVGLGVLGAGLGVQQAQAWAQAWVQADV